MDKKNIMIISQSLSGGGAEKLAANLSLGLAGTMNVYIVTYWEDNNEYEYAGERINIGLVGDTLISRVANAIKRIIRVKQLKKRLKINCSISYVPPCDYVNVLSKVKNEKVLIDVVSNMSTVYPDGIGHWLRKKVLQGADYLITVSEGVRQDIINNFGVSPTRVRTIYNSCDIKAIEKACGKAESALINNTVLPEKFISTMGSFRHPKGHWHLIKAFSTIEDDLGEYKLVICGDGIYREQYVELINKLNLQDRVILPGFINPPHGVISKSSLFVFSSVFEGFGNAVIEAMACGVPVVSTDCKYGPREILAPGTALSTELKEIEWAKYGVIVPAFSMDDIDTTTCILESERILGKAIKEILNNREKMEEYVELGRVYCRAFDNENITELWLKIIKEVVNGK